MLQRCAVALWVPRYFGGRRGPAAPPRAEPPGGPAANPRVSPAPPAPRRGTGDGAVLVPSANIAVRASAILERLRGAEDALVENRRIGFAPSMDSLEPRESIQYAAKTEVLSVLKKILSPASPRTIREATNVENNLGAGHSFMEHGKVTKRKLIPIPDEAVDSASQYARQLCMPVAESIPSISTLPEHREYVALSMNDIAIILQMYEAVECDDGALLLQLMAELERLVIDNNKANTEENVVAVPQLLLALSGLGIVEEQVLQKLTNTKDVFFSNKKLSRLSEGELVRLIVALHRFGLHKQVSFKAITKILRHRVHRNPIKSFVRKTLSSETTDGVPTCMVGLTVNQLLEALSAMALSQHRDSSVVNFLVATLVGAVLNEDSTLCSLDDHRFRTLQVHRAAKVCELMELTQPVLANLIHTQSTIYGGLFIDGGEDKIDPERVGFYDYVTADLVKANRG